MYVTASVETRKIVNETLTQTIVRYTYGESATGLLYIREVLGGTKTRFHWEGYDLYLEEVQSGTTWNSKYAYMNQPSAIGSTVARFDLGANYTLDSTDTYYFYHYDEAGNMILITDKNGNVVDHFEQDAWGNDLNNTFNTARAIAQHQTSKFYDTNHKLMSILRSRGGPFNRGHTSWCTHGNFGLSWICFVVPKSRASLDSCTTRYKKSRIP